MTFTAESAPLVVDASAAMALLDGDPGWIAAFDTWLSDDRMLLAPTHFLAEVANAQLIGRRAPAADIAARVERLVASGVQVADRGLAGLLEAVHLAERHGLTVYDALYLQLALDVDGEIATLDGDLARAARAEDVVLAN